jgi:aldehyde dehydrogenase (NAD+)
LKPSEVSLASSALLAELVPKYMDKDVLQIVNGEIPETTRVGTLSSIHQYRGVNDFASVAA